MTKVVKKPQRFGLFFRGKTRDYSTRSARDYSRYDCMGKRPEHFGEHKDLYNEDMRTFVRDYFGYNDQDILWLSEVDSDRIKQIIAGLSAYYGCFGRKIGNPFYPYPGYHMLVVRGYTDNQVITNDNGTKRGEKYPYDWNVFSLQIKQLEVVHHHQDEQKSLSIFCKNFYKED